MLRRPGIASLLAVSFLAACSGGDDKPRNSAPVARAVAAAPAGFEGTVISVSAVGSTDQDGDIMSYAWRQVSGPLAQVTNEFRPIANVHLPMVTTPQEMVFEVTLTDDDGARSVATTSITTEPFPRPSTDEFRTFSGERERIYRVYTPETYAVGNAAVLLLHSDGASMRGLFRDGEPTKRWQEIADAEGLLVILPNGYNERESDGLGDRQSWNDLRQDESGETSRQDDEAFLLQVLDEVATGRGFDEEQVLVTGTSNGGMMALRMLLNQPEHFVGAASFVGGLPEGAVPVPFMGKPAMLLNGTEDPVVLFEGGPVRGDGAPTRSVQATIDYFLQSTLADLNSEQSLTLPDLFDDACTIDEITWFDKHGALALVSYRAEGGGHFVPDPAAEPQDADSLAMLGRQCRDVHGVDLAKDFFDRVR